MDSGRRILLLSQRRGRSLLASDFERSAGLALLLRVLAIVVFWRLLEAECRPHRVTFPLDIGYFLYATNFALLPYYFWRTQRWRGLRKLLFVAGLWAGTYAFGRGSPGSWGRSSVQGALARA
jgi:hypothetical protein